ncbi:MAG: glycosyl hydrolase family 79 C-terminal domain-containing protein [Solirubrobacteraceae bacterium]
MPSRSSRWPLARITLLLIASAAAGIAAVGCGSTTHARAQPTFNVSGAPVGTPIPTGFVGLSLELKALEQYAGADPKVIDPVFLRLMEDIAPQQRPVLRLGGDSTDWSWWPVRSVARPPGVKFTLTPAWMDVAHSVAASVRGRLILGIDLEAGNHTIAAAEARAMVARIGPGFVDALELGNEPELYGSFGWYKSRSGKHVLGRPRSYDPAAFTREFSTFAPRLPPVRLAGPSSGAAAWLAQLGRFLHTEPRVRLATIHAYPLKHCTKSTVVTVAQLLSEQSSHGLAASLAPYVTVATRHHDPLRIDEMNAVSCGGTRGVSNSFASALWILDALFEMAKTGVSGVNVHTVPNTINEVLGPDRVGGGWRMRVHPQYYGMMMFAQAAPAGSRLLALRTAPPAGVKVWATRATNGVIHVVVINKRPTRSGFLRLRIAGAHGPAEVKQLRAPSVHATGGVTFGGQTFGAETATGLLAGPAAHRAVMPSGGGYPVTVPAASAMMLTVPGGEGR